MNTPFEDEKAVPEVGDPPELLAGDEKDAAITAAIQKLDPENRQFWTNDGKPQCNILTSMLRQKVSTEERDQVWDRMVADAAAAAEAKDAALMAPPAPTENAVEPVGGRGFKWKGLWAVLDTNAAAGAARVHYPMGIKADPVSLRSDRVLPLPKEIAAKFLNDESFHVFNAWGDQVENLPDAELMVAGRARPTDLAENEVVAKLSELSMEALLIRVNRMPEGESFNEGSSRAAMEAFYVDARAEIAKGKASYVEDQVPQLQELEPSQVARLLG